MIYVNVAHHYFEDEINHSLSAFITFALGHASQSMKTALSYQTIKMLWKLPPNIAGDVTQRSINNAMSLTALEKRMDEHQDHTISQLKLGVKPSAIIMSYRKRGLQSVELPSIVDGEQITLLFYERRLGQFDVSVRLAKQAVKQMKLVKNLNVNAQALRNLGFGYKTAAAVFGMDGEEEFKVDPKRKRNSNGSNAAAGQGQAKKKKSK
jgi:hypothetical protein